MKLLFLILGAITIATIANAEEKKDIEVCVKTSKMDDQFLCDYGVLKIIHIPGQAPIYFQTPPVATPTPAPKKGK